MFCGEPLLILARRARPAPDDQFHPFFWNISKSPNYERLPSLLHIAPAPGLSLTSKLQSFEDNIQYFHPAAH